MRAISPGPRDPDAKIGFREIKIAGNARDAFAFVEHQSHGLRLEFVIEPPALASSRFRSVGHGSGHRIHLSEDVHEIGSSADEARGAVTACGPDEVNNASRSMSPEKN